MVAARSASPPGRSLIVAANWTRRPSTASECSITRASTSGSMLPPQRSNTTRLPLSSGSSPESSAASAVAPAPSTTPCCISTSRRIASEMSSSLTITMRSTRVLANSKARPPTSGTARPSASVGSITIRVGFPVRNASAKLAARCGSTPITRTLGFVSLSAILTPAINPPPPTGTITASRSGTSSMSSSPIVPAPAMIAGSLKPWM